MNLRGELMMYQANLGGGARGSVIPAQACTILLDLRVSDASSAPEMVELGHAFDTGAAGMDL
ncbi:MAG: hypothetical protein WBB07_22845 [Mycobacterium sp.]